MAKRVGSSFDKEATGEHADIFVFLGDLGLEERGREEKLKTPTN